ncbi:TorF family putative porin [Asticcacaulis sp. SL142]|uniref:TorF family putative porin n=1 Tax=Asticcacaulis sp. SL142 TaxID=2995155 RepID=UPI00226D156B|nr:TorF family putative porin [Asticcacaulis sp. SL142]WAC48175.1 TorF family putative porin [Asticcacaulis sp. SL142]
MRKASLLLIATTFGASLGVTSVVQAAESGPFDIGGQVSIGNDGVVKGVSETNGNAQAVGTLTVSKGMFFAGTKVKNVKGSDGSDAQTQLFAGIKGDIAGFKTGLQFLYKANQNARPGVDDDFYEWQGDISRTVDKTTVKYTTVYSADSSGSTKEAWWHDLGVSQKLNTKWTVSGSVGLRRVTPKKDYTAYNLGATYALNKTTSLDMRYYDTDKHEYGKRFGDRVVLTLSRKF